MASSSSWLELSHILATPPPAPPPYLGALPPPPPSINDVAFDNAASDLLYTANSNGGVASWYGPGLARYTAWKADVRPTVPAAGDDDDGGAAGSVADAAGGGSSSSSSASTSAAAAAPRRLQTSWKKNPAGSASPGQQQQQQQQQNHHHHHSQHHKIGHGAAGVRQMYTDTGNIYSVSPFGIHCANRRGLPRWSTDVAAMGHPSLTLNTLSPSPTPSASDIVVAGTSTIERDQQIITINRHVGSVTRKVAAGGPILHLRKSQRYLLNSTQGGHIQLRDPRSLEIEHKLHAHPGGVIDMKSSGHLVWSVGWTLRLGQPVPEPLIKVHDLRSMRSLVPIPFAAPGGPAHLDIHPRLSSTVVVAAAQGAWQMVDMNNPGEAGYFQMSASPTGSLITALSLSPSAEYIAFGESDGSVRLWSTSDTAAALNHPDTMSSAPKFNTYVSSPPELPDGPEPPSTKQVDWTAETPLSSVGLPYYDHPLCSIIAFEHYAAPSSPLFNPYPPKIDPAILNSMRSVDRVHFAPLPRHLRGKRNAVKVTGRGYPPTPGGRGGKAAANAPAAGDRRRIGLKTPMFRSERLRAQQRGEGSEDTGDGDGDEQDADVTADEVDGPPKHWRKKDIVYSKFGVEDFDFGFYNKTTHSGLETHIPNCYLNSLLQCLYHTPLLRELAEIHTLSGGKARCERPDCLLCEAGYLFMMLRDARGSNCQATNFLRAFASSPVAASLGLMDQDDPSVASSSQRQQSDVAYANLIQLANRFVVDAMASAWAEKAVVAFEGDDSKKDVFERLLAPTTSVASTCQSCGHTTHRPSKNLLVDLVYPRKAMSNERSSPVDFSSILSSSLLREGTTRMTCKGCGNPSATVKSKRVLPETQDLPQTLCINANILTDEQMAVWSSSSANGNGNGGSKNGRGSTAPKRPFLPDRISIETHTSTKTGVAIKELRSPSDQAPASASSSSSTPAVYQLKSMIFQVQAPKEPTHLVAAVRTSDDGGEDDAEKWYLFNDFSVRCISEAEAVSVPRTAWKIPAVVYYERVDRRVIDVASIPWEKDWAVLSQDINISKHRDDRFIRHRVLSEADGEMPPTAGTLVSIDAEFVALNAEEMELSSSGSRSLVRPSTLSLARVSVLRGQGAAEGEPFIDDHIATDETIYDYLTQFSGIVDGDLDPQRSKHTVIDRKLAYKKLRLLVDLGCVFIGHGLRKDFRIINIHVPAKRVIDTVDLFSSTTHGRKLSLRFLSWFLLKESIQQQPHEAVTPALSAAAEPAAPDAAAAATAAASATTAGHDSIEDARAALHLFRIYETFKQAGRLEDVMEDLYEEGKRYNWRPPPNAGATVAAAAAAMAG